MPRVAKSKIGVTTLEDISALILQSHDLDETLRNIVNLVARRMHTDVCSIYLLDEDNETVIVDMGTPVNATQGATTTHTLTITDDD